ncbi:MAG: PEP-CTERM sorting domain-containing protein [Bryobacteraceae bacterium]|nr:PEP-CTERM sorting domain-containing protein [Bryobacteraceae bacterium]
MRLYGAVLFFGLALASCAKRETAAPDAGSETANPATKRPVYRNSVLRGGVRSSEELERRLATDAAAAKHYAGVRAAKLRPAVLDKPKSAYVSYRIGDRIYWTAKPVTLAAGETVLTGGEETVRARCGNRLSDEPETPVAEAEPEGALDEIVGWDEDPTPPEPGETAARANRQLDALAKAQFDPFAGETPKNSPGPGNAAQSDLWAWNGFGGGGGAPGMALPSPGGGTETPAEPKPGVVFPPSAEGDPKKDPAPGGVLDPGPPPPPTPDPPGGPPTPTPPPGGVPPPGGTPPLGNPPPGGGTPPTGTPPSPNPPGPNPPNPNPPGPPNPPKDDPRPPAPRPPNDPPEPPLPPFPGPEPPAPPPLATPEPGTMLLIGGALIALAAKRRRSG